MSRSSRCSFVLLVASLLGLLPLAGTGCCVYRPGGPIDPCGPGEVAFRPSHRGGCGGCGSCGREKGFISACKWGCGEVYWDEWLSDPPDCCDPCDDCGHWTGPQSCCSGGVLAKISAALWGCRGETCADGECCERRGGWCGKSGCSAGGCTDGGCSSCTDRAEWVPTEEGVPLLTTPAAEAPPVPQKAPKSEPKAKRPDRPYHPSYTRPASYNR